MGNFLIPQGEFEKWQACGNDFVLTSTEIKPHIDRRWPRWPKKRLEIADMCDRHFGIGADGVIFIEESEVADAKMTIINADGTEAEMCGNGIRCVGQYLTKKLQKDKLTVETLAGMKELLINGVDVSVNMGKAVVKWDSLVYPPDRVYDCSHIDIGNPHCVVFVRDLYEGDVEKYGPIIENQTDAFPDRTNVEFVELLGKKRIRVKVWERGVGRTLACGTGACASAFACYKREVVGNVVTVDLEGGDVEITIHDDDSVTMTGMAEFVYKGELPGEKE